MSVDHRSKLLAEVITLHNYLDDNLMNISPKEAKEAYYLFSEVWKKIERRAK